MQFRLGEKVLYTPFDNENPIFWKKRGYKIYEPSTFPLLVEICKTPRVGSAYMVKMSINGETWYRNVLGQCLSNQSKQITQIENKYNI